MYATTERENRPTVVDRDNTVQGDNRRMKLSKERTWLAECVNHLARITQEIKQVKAISSGGTVCNEAPRLPK